ncbi:MAG: helix-turn-helix domain-containing protein [Kofleriaceae bacterium]
MAKTRGRLEQTSGEKMTLTPEQRSQLRKRRKLELGWSLEYTAGRIGMSGSQLSNIETGARGHRQMTKTKFAELWRVLKLGTVDETDDARFAALIEKLVELDGRGFSMVESLVESQLPKSREGRDA